MSKERNSAICKKCGIRAASYSSTGKNGNRYYKKSCNACAKYPDAGDKLKQTHCSICLNTYHPVQLDMDHIDSDRTNNKAKNIQVICSNCHRLKSLMCNDYSTFKD